MLHWTQNFVKFLVTFDELFDKIRKCKCREVGNLRGRLAESEARAARLERLPARSQLDSLDPGPPRDSDESALRATVAAI